MTEISCARLVFEIFGISQLELEKCLDSLTPRERLCIQLSFGLTDDHGRCTPLSQIAKQFGVTKERVRQIKTKAIRKLRRPSRLGMYASFPKMEPMDPPADEPNFGPLDLPVRTIHILRHAGITEISQLTSLTQQELFSIKHMTTMDCQKILDAVSAVPELKDCNLMISVS